MGRSCVEGSVLISHLLPRASWLTRWQDGTTHLSSCLVYKGLGCCLWARGVKRSRAGGRTGFVTGQRHMPHMSCRSLSAPQHTRPDVQLLPQDSPRPRILEDTVQGIQTFSSERVSLHPGRDPGTGRRGVGGIPAYSFPEASLLSDLHSFLL